MDDKEDREVTQEEIKAMLFKKVHDAIWELNLYIPEYHYHLVGDYIGSSIRFGN